MWLRLLRGMIIGMGSIEVIISLICDLIYEYGFVLKFIYKDWGFM